MFISDSVDSAVFAPVAVALAQVLGVRPSRMFVIVGNGFSCHISHDIGDHGNLLVYGAGRYKFGGFVKFGTPLTVLAALVVLALAPIIWRG